MSTQHLPIRLRELRNRLGLSQVELANKAGVDKQTLSRYETGKSKNARRAILEKLAFVFNVDVEVLTGKKPLPAKANQSRGGSETESNPRQLNVRVGLGVRNAFILASRRYNFPTTRIVELAPYLFVVAAELSLKRRKQNLERQVTLLEATNEMQDKFGHLTAHIIPAYRAEPAIADEEYSLAQRDILADTILDTPDDDGMPLCDHDYFQPSCNPFIRYLQELSNGIKESAEIFTLDRSSPPLYDVCREDALRLADGDEDLARAISYGEVPLYEMPSNFFETNETPNRITWLRNQMEKIQAARELKANQAKSKKAEDTTKEDV